MELVGKDIKKDIMNMERFYLTIKFKSGSECKVEVDKNTFKREEYK